MSNPFLNEDDSPKQSKQAQLENTRLRTLETQQNALKSIYTSEQIGTETAAELLRQGEQLDKTNQRLDEISEKQKIGDKHIKNLKSGFVGGIIGLFKKGKEVPQPEIKEEKEYRTFGDTGLKSTVEVYNKRTESQSSRPESYNQNTNSTTKKGNYEEAFDRNLDDMSHGVSRLNNLAKGLGSELDRQNELLDEMNPKTEKINAKMTNQNKQLNMLLYGKAK